MTAEGRCRSASGTEYSLTSTLSESKTKSNEPLTKNYYSNWKCKTACFVFLFWHNSEDIKKVFLLSRHLCHLTSWWPSQLPYRIILPISTQVWIRRSLLDDIVIVFQARNSPKTKIHLMGFGSSPELSGYHCQHWYKGFIFGSFHRLFKSTALPFTARHNHLLISACRAMFRTTDPACPPFIPLLHNKQSLSQPPALEHSLSPATKIWRMLLKSQLM